MGSKYVCTGTERINRHVEVLAEMNVKKQWCTVCMSVCASHSSHLRVTHLSRRSRQAMASPSYGALPLTHCSGT